MAHKSNLRTCLIISMFFLAVAGLAQARTITVGPGAGYDFDTIQAGIDAANGDDTVLVASGEYVITVPITFRGKAITVMSETGPDETTIRMGTPADTNRGSVVVFENGETTESVLDGFMITGGTGSELQNVLHGGGIFFDASSATVRNCAIVQNRADVESRGGGVCCLYSCSPRLIDCIIAENSAVGHSGGGLSAYFGPSLTLTNCIVRGNSAGSSGGGMMCSYSSSMTLTNCNITGNSAVSAGGGMLCEHNSSVTMTDCIISENSTASHGAGVICLDNSSVTLSNCTIVENSAGNWGGGVESYRASSATVTNSILWGNMAPIGRQISVRRGASTLTIDYSNVAGGEAAADVEGGSTLNWGAGNIDADPLFAEPGYWADVNDPNIIVEPNDPNSVWVDGDYHLKSQAGRWDPNSESWVIDDITSPCIDAGDPNSDWSEELWPHGERINMGAYGGTSEASMSLSDAGKVVYIQWLGHASVKIWATDVVIYVDPRNLSESLHDATLVLVTHTHGDHYQPADIAKVSGPETIFIAPADVVAQQGTGQVILPDQTIQLEGFSVTAVPAYNTNKPNHPKANNWVGYIIEIASKRIYVAGDTDLIQEMQTLGKIDVAFLPAGGTYTMNATEAAQAANIINPTLAIPYHWGDIVGSLSDAEMFAEMADCNVKIMSVGEILSSEDWLKDFSLIAH